MGPFNEKDDAMHLEALQMLKEDIKKFERKIEQQLWKEIPHPTKLLDILKSYSKVELDKIRKKYQIKNVSSLKKDQLVEVLSEQIPEYFRNRLFLLDPERYKLINAAASNQGIIYNPKPDIHKLTALKEAGLLFPGIFNGEKVLILPTELQAVFHEENNLMLQSAIRRNDEWIKLSFGMAYYYGVVPINLLVEKIEEHTNKKIEFLTFFDVLHLAADYEEQAFFTYEGLVDSRVNDPSVVLREQNARNQIGYYAFTKKQLVEAADINFIPAEKTMKSFLKYLTNHYEIPKDELNDIAHEIFEMTNNNAPPPFILKRLQDYFEFPSFEAVQQLTEKLMDLLNNTRQWVLKGHTPNEVVKEERKHLQPLPNFPFAMTGGGSKVVQMDSYQKVGRNEPCSCGSGKKSKKCCGK